MDVLMDPLSGQIRSSECLSEMLNRQVSRFVPSKRVTFCWGGCISVIPTNQKKKKKSLKGVMFCLGSLLYILLYMNSSKGEKFNFRVFFSQENRLAWYQLSHTIREDVRIGKLTGRVLVHIIEAKLTQCSNGSHDMSWQDCKMYHVTRVTFQDTPRSVTWTGVFYLLSIIIVIG